MACSRTKSRDLCIYIPNIARLFDFRRAAGFYSFARLVPKVARVCAGVLVSQYLTYWRRSFLNIVRRLIRENATPALCSDMRSHINVGRKRGVGYIIPLCCGMGIVSLLLENSASLYQCERQFYDG